MSPAGRSTKATLDELGRPVELAIPDVHPVQLAYDARDPLESVRQPRIRRRAAPDGGPAHDPDRPAVAAREAPG